MGKEDLSPLSAFRTTAAYYEALFDSEARLAREESLLRSVFEAAPGPRVADIACGTGPHALFFAELGASQVSAFDLSEDMVAYAREHRPHPAIDYQSGDMRSLRGGPWDLIVCLGNSLALLPSAEAITAAFAAVSQTLSPGGLFLLQVLNFSHPSHREASHRVVRKEVDGAHVVAVKSLVPDGDHTLLSLSFFARHEERGHVQSAVPGATTCSQTSSVSESAVLLHPGVGSLGEAAQHAGLTLVSQHGAFDGSPFDPASSPDLIACYRKSAPGV